MLVQEERKACGEFGGAEIKDCETEHGKVVPYA